MITIIGFCVVIAGIITAKPKPEGNFVFGFALILIGVFVAFTS